MNHRFSISFSKVHWFSITSTSEFCHLCEYFLQFKDELFCKLKLLFFISLLEVNWLITEILLELMELVMFCSCKNVEWSEQAFIESPSPTKLMLEVVSDDFGTFAAVFSFDQLPEVMLLSAPVSLSLIEANCFFFAPLKCGNILWSLAGVPSIGSMTWFLITWFKNGK